MLKKNRAEGCHTVLFLLLFYNVTIHEEGIGVIEQDYFGLRLPEIPALIYMLSTVVRKLRKSASRC